MPLDDIRRDMKAGRVLDVHGNPVHYLVFVSELLGIELLLQVHQF